jgi:hypothetical protein
VNTKTGNMAGPTEDGVQYLLDQPPCAITDDNGNPLVDVRCPLFGLLPVMTDASWQGAQGTSYPVDIVNLPVFELLGLEQDPNSGGQGKGHQVVRGRFRERGSGVGRTDPNAELNYVGIRLWE